MSLGELAREITSVVQMVLRRYRAPEIKKGHTKHLERAITADLQVELNKFYYQQSILEFQTKLIEKPIPEDEIPSPEERAARIFMGLDPYPPSYVCHVFFSTPWDSEPHELFVTSEGRKTALDLM